MVGDWNCAQIEEMEEDGVPYEILFEEDIQFKEIFEDRTTVMRHELLGKHKFEIVDFSSHQLTLKDDEGEISTYKRTKR